MPVAYRRGLITALMLLGIGAVGAETTPSKQFVYVAGYNNVITCFTLDAATGTLTPSSTSEGGTNPSFLAWHPSHRFVYAVNEGGDGGRVVAFAVDAGTGALTRLGDASAAGRGPCHLAVHPSGKWLFTANYGSGHVGVLPLRDDGGVGEPTQILLPGAHAHQVVIDPTGGFVFVPCLGADAIAQFRFDAGTGMLTPNRPAMVATAKGAGPRHLALHPGGKLAYGINELDSTITRYTYDAAAGTLVAAGTVPTLPAGYAGKRNSTAEIEVSTSGHFLYGSNRGHDSIAIYRLDAAGTPTFVGYETGDGELRVPRHFSLDPSGRFAFVASQKADTITTFRVDADQGAWTRLAVTKVAPGPSFVAVMPAP